MERQATRLRAQRPLPGAPLSPVCTVSLRTAVASNLPAYRRWRSFETSCDPTDRPAGRNLTGNLFALLKLQRRHSPATRAGAIPPLRATIRWTPVLFLLSSAREMANTLCPFFQRSQSSSFCFAVNSIRDVTICHLLIQQD